MTNPENTELMIPAITTIGIMFVMDPCKQFKMMQVINDIRLHTVFKQFAMMQVINDI